MIKGSSHFRRLVKRRVAVESDNAMRPWISCRFRVELCGVTIRNY